MDDKLKLALQDLMENNTLWDDEIKALNSLVAEVEHLKQENERLKEVLRKCCPWNWKTLTCMICGSSAEGTGHTDDCEYTKLCGEEKTDEKQ